MLKVQEAKIIEVSVDPNRMKVAKSILTAVRKHVTLTGGYFQNISDACLK